MRLTGVLAAGILCVVLGMAGSASAASIATLYWRMGSAPSTADLYLDNSLGVPLGGLNVVVENATGFDLNVALPGVSPADSVYVVRPLAGVAWDVLVINNTASGVTLVPDGATAFLGTLHGAAPHLVPGETLVPGTGEPVFGASFYIASGAPVFGRIDELPPPLCATVFECLPGAIGGGFSITVPEPAAIPAAVAILCLACFAGAEVRRRTPLVVSRLAIAALLALSLAISARAAPVVELTVDLVGDPGRLTVSSSIDGPAVGGIAFQVTGASGFAFEPSPGLSLPDSGYLVDPLGVGMDALFFNNAVVGTPIVAPGQQVVLGHFLSLVSSQFEMFPGDDVAGASLFDATGNVIRVDASIASVPFVCDPSGHVICPRTAFLRFAVPEPAGSVALGLFLLAAFLLARRLERRRMAA